VSVLTYITATQRKLILCIKHTAVLLKIQVVWNVALCHWVNASWQSEGSSATIHPSTCYHIPEDMILIYLNLFLMLIFEVSSITVIIHCNLHIFFSLTIYTLTYFYCRGKGKGKGRYLGRFRHCSQVDLLYPCPQGVPSIISRGATYHAGTRDLC
jgi:hypothetical protein